jgi:hypothetical protein
MLEKARPAEVPRPLRAGAKPASRGPSVRMSWEVLMATMTCRAVFENGVFRPIGSLPNLVAEGQAVDLVVEAHSADEILKLVGQVYEGLSEEQIAEVEHIALERKDWFGRDAG